jgi:hypothetical protein
MFPLGFSQNDRLIPIYIELKTKTNICIKLLLILSCIGVPLLVHPFVWLDEEDGMALTQIEQEKPRRCRHNHHSDHPIRELAWCVHGDLDWWIDEVQLEDWCGHDYVGVEHLCPPFSSFEREGRRCHRNLLGSLACPHDPSEMMWKDYIR